MEAAPALATERALANQRANPCRHGRPGRLADRGGDVEADEVDALGVLG